MRSSLSRSGKFPRLVLAVACLLSGLLILVVVRADRLANSELLSNLLATAVALGAVICTIRVTLRSSGYVRRLWLLLTISLSLLAFAQALETYYQSLAHTAFATPWPSDIGFILWVIPVLIMFLPRPDEETIAWETILDFAQVAIVGLTAYLYFFYLTSRWEAEGPQMVMREIWLQVYRDLLLAGAFFLRSRASRSQPVRALFRRVSVFFLLTTGSSIAFLLSKAPVVGQAHWYDAAWCVPYLFVMGFAARWKTEDAAAEREPVSPGSVRIVSRVLPVCIPLLVLLMAGRIAQEQATLAWTAITASFFVSMGRLVLTNEKQLRISEDLRQAEAALRQSTEMFTTAFRSSPDAISLSLLAEARYVAVNESFQRMTGYSEDEIVGKTPADLGLWVNEERRSAIMAALQTGEDVKEEELLLRTKYGEVRTVQVSAARVQLGGRPALLGMVRDVTDRRRAEESLRVSEERFRTLVQNLHVGIVLLSSKAETLFANRAVLATFGTERDEILGKSTAEFEAAAIREDGTEMPFAARPGPRAIATKRPVYGEVVGWRRHGKSEVLWTLVDAVPQLGEGGEVASVLLSISDITERKRAEEALRESEERFRTLVERMHVGVVLIGPTAEITFATKDALEMFGQALESVLGKNSLELGIVTIRQDGTEIPFEMRPGPRVIATGQPLRDEVIGWRIPGSQDVLWTLMSTVPLFNREGKLEKVIGAFSNITKQKEAEEMLHQLSARLLHLQDEERRRLGRELHDSLAQNVMAVSLDLSQAVRSSPSLEKKARKALTEAREGLREMSRQIRTLSYLLHPPVLDELGLATAVKEYAQGFSERSGISLELDVQSDFARVSQEAETALFRIVQESLANIQRHSGSSTGKIRLRGEQGQIELEISDCGRGIPAKNSEGGAGSRSRLGVGILGMRERMVQLGGTLDIQSSPSGTVVLAKVPLATETADAIIADSRGG